MPASKADVACARDNFFFAACYAANEDLTAYFRDTLRWPPADADALSRIDAGAQEVKERIDAGEPVVLLDVRTAAEVATGRIAGALTIPVDELEARWSELERCDEVVCYCASGGRSRRAAELLRARNDAEAGWYLAGFREGLKQRKAAVQADIDAIGREEAGARDALSEAFEALKKYEHVNDAHATAARKEQDRRDTAALDELGLRRMSGR